ncbi:MAG TPA: YicC/YloC family endoribonuclease [Candidatus Acidoferrum sp.]|nr:YicC/YloC family endoribonuclease [Candidatus Acidoferrum sp.]
MTGFGRGEAAGRGRAFTVEVHSVNHRFLEVRCRVPKRLTGLEPRIQQTVQQRFARGHFEVSILDKDLEGRSRTLRVDVPLALQYADALRALQRELQLPGEVTLEMLTAQRELIAVEESEESLDETWAEVLPALAAALEALAEMRSREGEALVGAIGKHLGEVEVILDGIVARAPDLVRAQRDRLRERVVDLLEGHLPDPTRLEQEVAFLAERGDVAEECDRLRSHLTQFGKALTQTGPQGRRLDFLIQEMHREANTIGSKAGDASLAQEVVGLKLIVERLREQVQNIE